MIDELRQKLFSISDSSFESLAFEVFRYQWNTNRLYQKYCDFRGVKPDSIQKLSDIPCLPIEFFKRYSIKSGNWITQKTFLSSGTGRQSRSAHHIDDVAFYHSHAAQIFESAYGKLDDYVILALLPSYQKQGDSSLISMVDYFIKRTNHPLSGYFLEDFDVLKKSVIAAKGISKKVLIIGVTYALLNWAEQSPMPLAGCIVMETGGMKGRREEIIREDLHARLCAAFEVESIHSEYGMTELLSQAYAKVEGNFQCSDSMRVMVRDLNDPYSYMADGRSGGLNIIDLGNIQSISFIETKDIGIKNEDGTFTVLGRYDNSDIRGCNLLL